MLSELSETELIGGSSEMNMMLFSQPLTMSAVVGRDLAGEGASGLTDRTRNSRNEASQHNKKNIITIFHNQMNINIET